MKLKPEKKASGLAAQAAVPARARVSLTPGEAVRVMRELQEMTQAQLAAASGKPAHNAIR